MPNYKVKMGYGLHIGKLYILIFFFNIFFNLTIFIGWGIEGAIGS